MSIPAIVFEACATEKGIYDLTTPYPWGDWIYGTNGHVMVRCPIRCDISLTMADRRKVPDPARITEFPRVERVAVELSEAEGEVDCEWCEGSGKTDRYRCDNCGDTQRVMHKGKPLQFDCPECEGKGRVPNAAPVRVTAKLRYYLSARYVAMLRRHGVRLVTIPTFPPGDKLDDPSAVATFEGDGFEGWLMPLSTVGVELDIARRGEPELASKGA